MSDSLDLIIPVFVASASALGSVIVWWLNQSAARSAIAREHKRDLYQQLIEAVFILCGLNHEEDEHYDALYALDRAWLYASRGVLQVTMDFLRRYTEVRDLGDEDLKPRDDERIERLIHRLYSEMRRDLVPKPWYTLGQFEFPKIRGSVEFYEWSQNSYDGLLRRGQVNANPNQPPAEEPTESASTARTDAPSP